MMNATDEWENITSPNYPNNYDTNADCEWTIYFDYGNVVLEIIYFNVEDGYDFVTLYNGTDINSPKLASLTGSSNYYQYYGGGNHIYIHFTSDLSTTFAGFHFRYKGIANTNSCTMEPCQNGGICINLDSSYYCQCTGFKGSNCENGMSGDIRENPYIGSILDFYNIYN